MKWWVKRQLLITKVLLLPLTTIAAIAMTTVLTNALTKNSIHQSPIKFVQCQSEQSEAFLSGKTDFWCESSDLIANVFYRRLSALDNELAPSGANGVNAQWESKQTQQWYIEAQRYGEELIIGGLIKNDPKAVEAGFSMFDWGFAKQASDGSFSGTGDPFHSTSMFVQAVARTLLVIQQSPHSKQYTDKIAHYTPLLHRAARWMISDNAWRRGINNNKPYTHRRYIVATALGLTSKLSGDQELVNYARTSIQDGLSLQREDGVNPEKGGHDSSYQMVGVVYAQRWVTYFSNDSLTPKVKAMIERSLDWEHTKILPTGEISNEGNTRTGGQERGRSGKVKKVDNRSVYRGFAYWACVTGNKKWKAIAQQIAQHYYNLP